MTSESGDIPHLVIRPRADNAVPDAIRRLKAAPGIGMAFVAALAALGGALAYGHALPSVAIISLAGGMLVIGIAALVVSFRVSVLGSPWTLYPDRLVVQRPGAPVLAMQLAHLGGVRLESITGFGLQEPILKFIDIHGGLLFWTVASRWADQDLSELWEGLHRSPVNAVDTVNDFQAMPYDRRY